jgi:hypothetical protein
MIPMSSRRRAVVEFLIGCSLFVNEKAIYSITGMTQFYIKSASATMVKREVRLVMAVTGYLSYSMTVEARPCVPLL